MPHRSRQIHHRRYATPSRNLHSFPFSTPHRDRLDRPDLNDEEEISPRTVTFPGIPELTTLPNEDRGPGMATDARPHPNTYPDDNNTGTQPVGHSAEYYVLKELCRLKAERASHPKHYHEPGRSTSHITSVEDPARMRPRFLESTSLIEVLYRPQYFGNSPASEERQELDSILHPPRETIDICDHAKDVLKYITKMRFTFPTDDKSIQLETRPQELLENIVARLDAVESFLESTRPYSGSSPVIDETIVWLQGQVRMLKWILIYGLDWSSISRL